MKYLLLLSVLFCAIDNFGNTGPCFPIPTACYEWVEGAPNLYAGCVVVKK